MYGFSYRKPFISILFFSEPRFECMTESLLVFVKEYQRSNCLIVSESYLSALEVSLPLRMRWLPSVSLCAGNLNETVQRSWKRGKNEMISLNYVFTSSIVSFSINLRSTRKKKQRIIIVSSGAT